MLILIYDLYFYLEASYVDLKCAGLSTPYYTPFYFLSYLRTRYIRIIHYLEAIYKM